MTLFDGESHPFRNFLIFLGLSLCVFFLFFGFGDNSRGVREGSLIKFSEKGWIWQTFEGELAMNSFVPVGNSVSPYVFSFSVCNKNSFNTSMIFDNLGKRVKINYHSPLITKHWVQESMYCVDSIEVLE